MCTQTEQTCACKVLTICHKSRKITQKEGNTRGPGEAGYLLLLIMSAPMTPGTQPQRVSRKMIRTDPHPLSITARGGKKMHRRTRRIPIGN
jgi:hypothetical protein